MATELYTDHVFLWVKHFQEKGKCHYVDQKSHMDWLGIKPGLP
jgi:hypothetical protein